MDFGAAALVVAFQSLVAIAFYPATAWTGLRRRVAFVIAFALVAVAPMTIDESQAISRLVAALGVGWLASKLLDACFGIPPQNRPDFFSYVRLLANPFWIVYRIAPPKTARHHDLRLLAWRVPALAIAMLASIAIFRIDWARWPFLLEHAAKSLTVMSVMIAGTNLIAAIVRLAGGRALDFMARPLTAATPAEFWRRWNLPAQQLFHTYAAKPLGGMRRPVRAVLRTFLVSALGHEYIFSTAVGHVQGYQTLFFLIQGVAAVATLRARPTGWQRIPCIVATQAFIIATTVIFGMSVNEFLPLYARR